MSRKRRPTGRSMSIPAGIAAGIGIALAITVLGAMVLAWLVVTERLGEDAIGWGCMVILPLASAAGSVAAWRLIRHQRLTVSMITCGGYYLALLAIALLFGGGYEGLGVTALLVLLGGGIGLIPALFGGGSGARRHKIPALR